MAQQKDTAGETITISKNSLWKYSTFVLLAIVLLGGFYMLSQGKGSPTGNVVANNPSPVQQPSSARIEVKTDGAPMLGSKSAPVTIVEFSDFQCPFCEKAYSDAVKNIKQQYIDSGKANLVYMDYPLPFHPEALPAARAARCFEFVKGGSDAEFFKYHDKLFENQDSLSTANYKKWALDLGANGAQFDQCFDSDKFTKEVNDQQAYGSQLGVGGTPTFFVNGKELVGAQPFAAFKQVIDAELA